MNKQLSKLVIGVSPLTNRIYAGYISKDSPNAFSSKVDVTDDVLNAVVDHMKRAEERNADFAGYEFSAGTLLWERKTEASDNA